MCSLWHEMNTVHPALTICVGISHQWFPLCFQRHYPTTWPVPVLGSLHLLPLQGGYSSHYHCEEWLELLDTHHAFTLDSHGFPLLGHMVLHAPCYTSGINTHEGTGKAMAEAWLRSLPHNGTHLYGITVEYIVSYTCYHPLHKCDT